MESRIYRTIVCGPLTYTCLKVEIILGALSTGAKYATILFSRSFIMTTRRGFCLWQYANDIWWFIRAYFFTLKPVFLMVYCLWVASRAGYARGVEFLRKTFSFPTKICARMLHTGADYSGEYSKRKNEYKTILYGAAHLKSYGCRIAVVTERAESLFIPL